MKFSLVITLLLAVYSSWAQAYSSPIILQLKYSPWGDINAEETEFNTNESGAENYDKYTISIERSYSARFILSPFYLSTQHSSTNVSTEKPEAQVDTFSVGFAGIDNSYFEDYSSLYLMGGLGIGIGRFRFKDSTQDSKEWMIEGNGEIGLRLGKHLLMGTGIDYQHFGEVGESKASSWTFYFSTGIIF